MALCENGKTVERNMELVANVLDNLDPNVAEVLCTLAPHSGRQGGEPVPSYEVDLLLVSLGSILDSVHVAQEYVRMARQA